MNKTKYPILLVHGTAIRDNLFYNSWGKIPEKLEEKGFKVFFSEHDAWSTFEVSAEKIRDRILDIIAITNAKKIHIIAHSKAGVEVRYVISSLRMGKYVSTLTTVNSPHQGIKLIDKALKVPKIIRKTLSCIIDIIGKISGDENPDFYNLMSEFSTEYMEKFNKENIDDENVEYYSAGSSINVFCKDAYIIPFYLILKCTDGPNDGTVPLESMRWGEFSYIGNLCHGATCSFSISKNNRDLVYNEYIKIAEKLLEKELNE